MAGQDKSEQGVAGWWSLADAVDAHAARPASHFPLPGWPAQSTVEYLTKLILLALLLLAIPYILGNLILRPVETLAASAEGAFQAVPLAAK